MHSHSLADYVACIERGDWRGVGEIMLASALSDFSTVRRQTRALEALAAELRQPSHRWFTAAMNALLALHAGNFAEADELIESAYELGRDTNPTDARSAYAIQRYLLCREQGRPELAYELVTRMAEENPARPFFRCALGALAVDLGRTTEARRLLEELAPDRFEILPRDNEWLLSAAFLTEMCRALEDLNRAAILYDELVPLAERSSINPSEGTLGATARSLGILAAIVPARRAGRLNVLRALQYE